MCEDEPGGPEDLLRPLPAPTADERGVLAT